MIDYLVIYNKNSGMNVISLGNKKNLFGKEEYSDFIGALFSVSKNLKDFEINDKGFTFKLKQNKVLGLYDNRFYSNITNKNYGIVMSGIPEKNNIFKETLCETYNFLKDESSILGLNFKKEINEFNNIFSKKFKKMNLFYELNVKSLNEDFKVFSNSLLDSIKELYGSKDLEAYTLCKDLVKVQKKYLSKSFKNIENIEFLLSEYNLKFNTNITLNSSIIQDYGKSKLIFDLFKNIIKDFDSPLSNPIEELINSKINLKKDYLCDFKQAIKESYNLIDLIKN